ncbi:MAG: hypothetical protein AB7F19_02490 [Candidatus Babeliales bacterium]
MKAIITPCLDQLVSVILRPHQVDCILLEEVSKNNFTLKYSAGVYAQGLSLAQPVYIENFIREFLHSRNIPNAFVAIAMLSDTSEQTISSHELLQCQLLAINTPFHCAGITTHARAQEYAHSHHASGENSSRLISNEDFLCSIGLYLMARKPQR